MPRLIILIHHVMAGDADWLTNFAVYLPSRSDEFRVNDIFGPVSS